MKEYWIRTEQLLASKWEGGGGGLVGILDPIKEPEKGTFKGIEHKSFNWRNLIQIPTAINLHIDNILINTSEVTFAIYKMFYKIKIKMCESI